MFILIAQGQPINIASQIGVISPILSLGSLIEIAADAVLLIGTLGVLYYLLYGAFSWITAGGEKGKIEEARSMMTQGIVGLIILASVFLIFGLVLNFLGLKNRINIGGYGGTTGGTQTGGGTGADICVKSQSANDGGAGRYCTLNGQYTAARVLCTQTATITYLHWEPTCCVSGQPAPGVTFIGAGGTCP